MVTCNKQTWSGETGARWLSKPCPRIKGHKGVHGRYSIRIMPTDNCILEDVKICNNHIVQ